MWYNSGMERPDLARLVGTSPYRATWLGFMPGLFYFAKKYHKISKKYCEIYYVC